MKKVVAGGSQHVPSWRYGVAVQEEKGGGLKPWRVQVGVKSFGVVWR